MFAEFRSFQIPIVWDLHMVGKCGVFLNHRPPTTYYWPPTTNYPITDLLRRPLTNRGFKDQNNWWRIWRCVMSAISEMPVKTFWSYWKVRNYKKILGVIWKFINDFLTCHRPLFKDNGNWCRGAAMGVPRYSGS